MTESRKNQDVFAQETLSFVKAHASVAGHRWLEVGCGTGEFGSLLVGQGAELDAIDTNQQVIDSARQKGLNAHVCDVLDWNEGGYDGIIFTRSLHHIHHLDEALGKAHGLLKPGGNLLLEEFDMERIDEPSAQWYYDLKALIYTLATNERTNLNTKEPLNHWAIDHEHDPPLHTGEVMMDAVKQKFNILSFDRCPYLYRSICRPLTAHTMAYEVTTKILDMETQLIEGGQLLPNGLRVVAQKPETFDS